MKKNIIFLIFTLLYGDCIFSQSTSFGTSTNGSNGHHNVMTFFVNGNSGTSSVRIATNIPYGSNNNTTLEIKGNNQAGSANVQLLISWHYEEGQMRGLTASSGGYSTPNLYLLKDDQNKISLFLENEYFYSTRFEITAYANGLSENSTWYTNWQVENNTYSNFLQYLDYGYNPYTDDEGYLDFYNINYNNKFQNVNATSLYSNWLGSYQLSSSYVYAGSISSWGNTNLNNLTINGAISANYNGWRPYGMYFSKHNNHFSQNAYYNGRWRAYQAGGEYSSAVMLQTASADGQAFKILVDNSISAANEELQFSTLFNVTNTGNVGIGLDNVNPVHKLQVQGNTALNGRVMIGTIDASKAQDFALAVNGSAIFNKAVVKLYTNWPDYVFDPLYKLRPLSNLEEYITKHKHLPDVPSAAEVGKDGVDIGATQAALLQKIEELTLYIIEQNKKLTEQNLQISQQNKKTVELSEKLKLLESKLEKLISDKK